MSTAPPHTRQFLTSLLTSFSTLSSLSSNPTHPAANTSPNAISSPSPEPINEAADNPLAALSSSPQAKALLVTLHCVFPHLLLPALDVLDRTLATRFILTESETEAGIHAAETSEERTTSSRPTTQPVVYYVRSKTARNESSEGPAYEVRLKAWNCTCAAFAFAAAEGMGVDGGEEGGTRRGGPDGGDGWGRRAERSSVTGEGFGFGGLRHGVTPPVCKHLLACVLAECWPDGFGTRVSERRATRMEVAGLAAGYW